MIENVILGRGNDLALLASNVASIVASVVASVVGAVVASVVVLTLAGDDRLEPLPLLGRHVGPADFDDLGSGCKPVC